MKFAHLHPEGQQRPRLAVVIGERAAFVGDLIPGGPETLQELISRGDEQLTALRSQVAEATSEVLVAEPWVALASLRFDPAVIDPPHVLAIGANYAAHASELQLRNEKAMTVFALWPNSLAAHEQTTTWPADVSTQVDYEAELGVIIGKPAKYVSEKDALKYVWGYTAVNDITARDIQFREAQWSRCKSFDGFTPNGPFVVTADEIPDPNNIWLTCVLDGQLVQDGRTNDMIRSVARIISELSQSATLMPGTLISTGSPGGAGYSRTPPIFLKDGSTVTVTIEGIGSLTTHCRVI